MYSRDDSVSGFQFRYDIDMIFYKISRYWYRNKMWTLRKAVLFI